jgi:hypothetical protein
MSNRSVPNLEERLKHASEAKKSMLVKFKMSAGRYGETTPAPSHRRREGSAADAA